MIPDGWLWGWFGVGHKLTNGVEDDGELVVVFPLKLLHLTAEFLVACQEATQADKGSDDLDACLNGCAAVQHTWPT